MNKENQEWEKEFDNFWVVYFSSLPSGDYVKMKSFIAKNYIPRQSLSEELEKMKKPERKEARTTREKLYLGYNKCLSDLKQKFGV